MAAGSISLDLTGALAARPATCNGAGSDGSNGPVFQLALRQDNRSAAVEISQAVATIDSPAPAFEALPLPGSFFGRLVYLRTQGLARFLLRVTYEVSGAVTIPLYGSVLLEAPADDRITALELQGQGSLGWLAAGDVV